MRLSTTASISFLSLFLLLSCGQSGRTQKLKAAENSILQQNDGTISLILDKAECYSDVVNPSNNTADWNVVITNPGHFKVWLSSATKDTSALGYANSVRIRFLDDQLEVNPVCDKVFRNSNEVHYPFYRADSYMGSIFVSDPGEYNIQLISEKVIAGRAEFKNAILADDTKLLSVILTPITH